MQLENLRNVASVVTAIAAIFGAGSFIGYHTAQSELRSVQNQLELATSAKGASETIRILGEFAKASDDLFRFEAHATEVIAAQEKISSLDAQIILERSRVEALTEKLARAK